MNHIFGLAGGLARCSNPAGRKRLCYSTALATGALALGLGFAPAAQAQTVSMGNVTITLQSTLDYTLGYRTAGLDRKTLGLNTDDGDRNFSQGLMANRFQTLEQLNIRDGDYGLRASAFAWLDTTYLQNNRNNSPGTYNPYNIGQRSFTPSTVANEGRRIEPLALFVYGSEGFDNGNQQLSWQVGRQTITWGEALFSLNGIAGLQAPVDVYEASLLPNPQAQALFLPTGAVQASYSLGTSLSFNAYWQFEYEPDVLDGVGSYFSSADFVGPGGQRILGSTASNAFAASLYRSPDIRPANGLDQFGFAVHKAVGNYGLGLYFVRGIPKAPSVYTALTTPSAGPAGPKVGQYNLAYGQPVNAVAVSGSTVVAQINLAGELSNRFNTPLISDPTYTTANPAHYGDPLYAVGDVLDAQMNGIYEVPPLPLLPNGGTFEGELTLNDVLSVSQNEAAVVPGNTNIGGAFEAVFTPNWYPVSYLEIEAPIGYTNTFLGNSKYSGANAGTSTIDVGLEGVYDSNLTVGVNYQRYSGPPNRQVDIDRDFITAYVQRTF